MKRTKILFILFIFSIFNINAQPYEVYEYYELLRDGRKSISEIQGAPQRYYYEYKYIISDFSILNGYTEMNPNMNIFDIKPEEHTTDFLEVLGNNAYKLLYTNGNYDKYYLYFRYNPTGSNYEEKVYRKRIFNDEDEYNEYLLNIMNIQPLPIELLNFNGVYNDIQKSIDINWSTASETNNDFFNIEYSNDGYIWQPIYETKGAGNTNIQTNYKKSISISEINYEPLKHIYIRLNQTDFNGYIETFSPISIIINETPPIYVYYDISGQMYDEEEDIKSDIIYIQKDIVSGQSIKKMKKAI